ncbi:hypothetical protein MSAN_00610100 [Mycena sanguinolenta]|uniref:Uncharacterized protein n=1 Tax=Mycena sanguinolenta TaxID=230812 RepID=A0A8H7DFY1_9AGAR|nr:hypothetical protein MSAN_00610100 [Mycena sanguinolenta]
MPPKRFLCICTKCVILTHIDDTGQIRPGNFVSRTTFREHEDRDRIHALTQQATSIFSAEELQNPETGGQNLPEAQVFQQALAPITGLCTALAAWLSLHVGIEDHLEQSFQQEQARQNMPVPETMRDIQDSPAWRSLGNYLLTRYHLVFAFYVDWFNPFTMKIAGQVLSFGVIILYCLNLPIEVRFRLENIFIVGIIPGDPDIWTTTHILISFAEMMNKFASPGEKLQTFRNPLGVLVAARILPLIADLQALRKVAGYMAFNATQFCTWCLLKIEDIEDLNYRSWALRNSATVSAQAQAWHNAISATKKNALSKDSGVRWSPIHDIIGFDPVLHIVLGFMHNWLEGILARHLRFLWGIGRPKTAQVKDNKSANVDIDDGGYDSELTETSFAGSEPAEAPDSDPEIVPDSVPGSTPTQMDVDDENSDHSTTPTPETYLGIPPPDSLNEEDEFEVLDELGMFNFSSIELGAIRTCIRNISLPTWVARPPGNLVIFPLIIPELWWDKGNIAMKFLENFHNLVACTNILSSFSTSNAEADIYTDHYVRYRRALPHLFPIKFKSVPNHHFAMHNGPLLKFWGPLAALKQQMICHLLCYGKWLDVVDLKHSSVTHKVQGDLPTNWQKSFSHTV